MVGKQVGHDMSGKQGVTWLENRSNMTRKQVGCLENTWDISGKQVGTCLENRQGHVWKTGRDMPGKQGVTWLENR